MSIFISWLVLIISVACAIGIMRILHSVKKIERFSLTNNSLNKTPD
ncbi:TPA: hypothetical protein ACH9UH_001178 [Escherichia coli]|nr:hypothetical protein [Escherichia coli]EEY7748782.1 hypothetical protein [Escherichia coli]EEY8689469.1 hypothetical protein [Escherichia coli]EFC1442183.1 hypothetical protein [Escherichia coli]EFC3984362.1 hypothetical protein [Escherichia coli]EGO6729514.1 hypothetical protein [Escherichia coli]